jgi:hypothetical protein
VASLPSRLRRLQVGKLATTSLNSPIEPGTAPKAARAATTQNGTTDERYGLSFLRFDLKRTSSSTTLTSRTLT